jgi:hypothetical protein
MADSNMMGVKDQRPVELLKYELRTSPEIRQAFYQNQNHQ